MTDKTFEDFGFAEPLARALTQCGYATPTPIQSQTLPPQLEGRDLLGLAETGSGKTAAFVLPILQRLAAEPREPGHRQVLALILAPTRELVLQINQEIAALSRNMRIRHAVVLGGVGKGPQIHAMKRGVHILVATPGRLLDHVTLKSCDLSHVDTLVLDEADRMFDMGFIRDIRKIVSLLPTERRTALLSATMPKEIKKFAYEVLKDPYRIDLSSKQVVVDRIDQKVMLVPMARKQSRLHTLLDDPAFERVIVFARTKRGADRVADRLGMAGINAVAFHGNKAQNMRQRALGDFTAGHVRVLVATDIAARGIDVSNVTHVINFDMPNDPETYVHRVGRTARKGLSGTAISLCDPSEKGAISAIEKMMKSQIEVIDDVGGDVLPAAEKKTDARETRSFDRPRGERREHRREGGERGGRREREDRGERRERSARGPRQEDIRFEAGAHQEDVHNGVRPSRGERAGAGRDREGGPRHRDGTARGGFRSGFKSRDGKPSSRSAENGRSHESGRKFDGSRQAEKRGVDSFNSRPRRPHRNGDEQPERRSFYEPRDDAFSAEMSGGGGEERSHRPRREKHNGDRPHWASRAGGERGEPRERGERPRRRHGEQRHDSRSDDRGENRSESRGAPRTGRHDGERANGRGEGARNKHRGDRRESHANSDGQGRDEARRESSPKLHRNGGKPGHGKPGFGKPAGGLRQRGKPGHGAHKSSAPHGKPRRPNDRTGDARGS